MPRDKSAVQAVKKSAVARKTGKLVGKAPRDDEDEHVSVSKEVQQLQRAARLKAKAKARAKALKAAEAEAEPEAPARRKRGSEAVARREIAKNQRSSHLLMAVLPLQRWIRKVADDSKLHFESDALKLIQEAAESELVRVAAAGNRIAQHAPPKRRRLNADNFALAVDLAGSVQ